MIELKEPRPPASSDELEAAEQRLRELGHQIPPSYRAFLAEQDGGRPVRDTFSFEQRDRRQSDRVQIFLGVGAGADGTIVDTVELLGDIPPGVLPIADDPFGNSVCLDGRDGRDGPVLFWDHEQGFDDGEPDESNLYEIAPDLQSFLDSLTDPPAPPELPEQPQGWRRMFGRR